MDKYINSLIRGFKKIFNRKYFAIVSVFIGIVTVLGVSYGYLSSESGWQLAAQLRISKLYYSIAVDGVSTNEIVAAANSGTTYYNVEITSLNDINTRYALTYKVTGTATVGVSSSSTNAGSGVIGLYSTGTNTEKKKTVRIAVTNNSSNTATVTLSIAGGYTWNSENQISVKTGYAIVSGINYESQIGTGLTLAEEIDGILGCTPTSSTPCRYTNNSNNYLTYANNTWRIIGTYLVDSKPVVKAILNEPLTSKVTYANVSSTLTTFYNGLSDKALIQGTATSLTKAEYDAIGGVNSYLYTKPDKDYWTGTQYYVGTSRGAVNKSSTYTAYVRPVIQLKYDVVNANVGEYGTPTNPYQIVQGYTLTFEGMENGITNLLSGYYGSGRTYTLNNPVSVNVGYEFDSWEVTGTGASLNGTTFTMGTANTTLTATWNPVLVRAGVDSTTGLPVVRYGTEEFYDITNAIDYSSLISTNGNLYNYASGKSILLAKYNLYVGQTCTSDSSGSCTPISTSASGYGLQSADAKGYVDSSTPRVAVVPFSGSSTANGYWYDSANSTIYSKYGTSYNASNIYDTNYITAPNYSVAFYNNTGNANYSIVYYVEEYVERLGIEGTGRLLTYTEANAMTKAQRTNGAQYWLGSAYNNDFVRYVYSSGYLSNDGFFSVNRSGVRPVIVVNTADIKLPFTRNGTDSTTGLPVVKITGTNEEFYDITNAINYTSLINTNGNIYNYAADKSILLAKYNLYVGRIYDGSTYTEISASSSGYGLQSADAKGYADSSPRVGVVPFSGSSTGNGYWYDSANSTIYSKYGTSYNASNIYDATYNTAPNYSASFSSGNGNTNYSIAYYVEEYVDRLGIEGEGRLLTYTEANAMTTAQRTNGARYWLGSASSNNNVRSVYASGGLYSHYFYGTYYGGVRPVIIVSTSDIGA